MSIFCIGIITLLCYSGVATIVYLLAGQREEVAALFGLGIVGGIILLITKFGNALCGIYKYRIGKRSIFVEDSTGTKYKCKTAETDNIILWTEGYTLQKRYATKCEWQDVPDFNTDFLDTAKINCDNCKYDNECRKHLKCTHDDFGAVLEFNMFEKRKR